MTGFEFFLQKPEGVPVHLTKKGACQLGEAMAIAYHQGQRATSGIVPLPTPSLKSRSLLVSEGDVGTLGRRRI